MIVFWRCISFHGCKGMFMCVCKGICGSCVFVLRKALFTLSIDTVSFFATNFKGEKFVSA